MLTEKDIFIGAKFDTLSHSSYQDKYDFTWDLAVDDDKGRFVSVVVVTSDYDNGFIWDNRFHGKLVHVANEDFPTRKQWVPMEFLQPIGSVIQDDGQYSFLPML